MLAPIFPRVMEEGESKKAALILMKNSRFDRTLRYGQNSLQDAFSGARFRDSVVTAT